MTRGDFMIRGVSMIPGDFMIHVEGTTVFGRRPGMTAGTCTRICGMLTIAGTFGMRGRTIDKAFGTSSGIECALGACRT